MKIYRHFNMSKRSSAGYTGFKPTRNQRQVLEILQDSDHSLSAREVWQRLPASKIGFATVYRALSALCNAALVRKILSENSARYEHMNDEHTPQLICSRCGKAEEVTDPTMLRYNASIMKRRGLAEHGSLLLYADCRRKECDEK